MDDQTKDGLKADDGVSVENQSSSENDQPVSDDIKDQSKGESKESDEAVDRLLDGTSGKKEIRVRKDRFDDRNEKAKLYETFAPVIEKVIKDPEAVERLLETKKKGDLESQMREIIEERKQEQRLKMRTAVKQALDQYPAFEQAWSEIQEDVMAKIKRGVSPAEAIRREYIAYNPDYARSEEYRTAQEGLNREGYFSGGSHPPRVDKITSAPRLSEDEKRIAQVLGKSPEEYGKLLEKHQGWVRKNLHAADEI